MGGLVLKKVDDFHIIKGGNLLFHFLFPIVKVMQLHEGAERCIERGKWRDFPGGPVVWILHFCCKGHRFNPWSGN